ncbi:uncharacterized protein LOC128884300 isoform X2 [Hylaeus volcanicus]|nr:uncharacterized protein LOC128884300 isoform X2 [Hylaeus volcanicus]
MNMMQNNPLIKTVDDSSAITVFLPSNDAVEMYNFPNNGANLPSDIAFAIFSNHILLSNIKLDSIQAMQLLTVGKTLVQIEQDPFTLETRIAIGHDTCYQSAIIENINAPIFTSNGIVYIISTILMPTPVIDYVKFHRLTSCS